MIKEMKRQAVWSRIGLIIIALGLLLFYFIFDSIGFFDRAPQNNQIIIFFYTLLAMLLASSWIILPYGIFCLFVTIKRNVTKGIEEFCEKSIDPEAVMTQLEDIWKNGFATKHCRLDGEYIIWRWKSTSGVIPFKSTLWVNGFPGSRLPSPYGGTTMHDTLMFYFKDGQKKKYKFRVGDGMKILLFIRDNCPNIFQNVVNANKDAPLHKLWQDGCMETFKAETNRRREEQAVEQHRNSNIFDATKNKKGRH